jgi:beta-glucanase (GH16 family)
VEYIPAEKKVYQTIHWYVNNEHHSKSHSFVIDPDVPHVVALEWTEDELIFYFDGKLTQHLKKSDNPKYVPSAFQMVYYSMSAGIWGGNMAEKGNSLPAFSHFAYAEFIKRKTRKHCIHFRKPMLPVLCAT